jgi:hypothetical protein
MQESLLERAAKVAPTVQQFQRSLLDLKKVKLDFKLLASVVKKLE